MALTLAQCRAVHWAAMALVAGFLVWLLAPVPTPVAIGAMPAYALHPAVEKLAARRMPRLLAVALVEIVAFVAATALLLLVVPILSKELPLLRDRLPVLAERITASGELRAERPLRRVSVAGPFQDASASAGGSAAASAARVAAS